MLCGISGEAPTEPVVSRKTGTVYEKRLIEQYLKDNRNTEPGNPDVELIPDDLLALKTARIVRPRPPTLTSIPALLSAFQDEWDALALETYKLQAELSKTRQELATSLYQHDAAVRVVARLTKERNEARDALAQITVSSAGGPGAGAGAGSDAMAIDSVETLPEDVVAMVEETHQKMSKSRKKRPVPEGWVTPDEIVAFKSQTTNSLPVSQVTAAAVNGDYAAVSGLEGQVGVYSVKADELERQLSVGGAVTDSVWTGTKLIFSTANGSIKVFDSGSEVASLSDHAGAATGLSLSPTGDLLASVGADKSLILYSLNPPKRVGRCYADSALSTCAFHPDGHLIALGTSTGEVKMYMTTSLEQAAAFHLGAPIQAMAFSENGFWLAATAKGQSTVTIFDLRKEGDAAAVKVLEAGGAVNSLAWDYTGQFLAMGGGSGVSVQQYAKSSKKWSEPFRVGTPVQVVRWGEGARKLIAVNKDGVTMVFGAEVEKEG